jgi:hypothetical protein
MELSSSPEEFGEYWYRENNLDVASPVAQASKTQIRRGAWEGPGQVSLVLKSK